MSSSGNTIGILVPQPSAPAMVSQGSANPPEPLTNAAGPVDVIEMVADVASSALSLVAPDSAAANVADAVSDVVSLASMVPGLPSIRLPSRKMVSGFGGGSGAGSDGGVVTSGHGHCIPCKVAAAIGNPVNAVLGIKVLFDDTETDFAFDSPLPLVWQRSYYSDQIGNGWLGQGWSLPFSMRLVRTADGFLYIDEQGREIPLPDISDEADEPYSAADDDEDDLYEEEAAPRPASAEEDPYGLDNAYFDPYEQIFFSQISDDLYQIASPDGGARLLFAEVDSGCGIFQLVAQLDRNGRHIRLCYDDNGLPHSIYDGSGRHFQPVFSSIRLHDNDPDFDPAGERDVFVSEDERFYVNRLTSVTFNGKELVRYDYNGYGDLTAVYGRDGKKLRGFAYRNHIMVEHSQPDGLVSRYEYDRYDTDGKVLKSSNNLGEEWTFAYRKDHTVVTDALGRTEVYGFDENRELVYRIDADGQRSDSERDDYGRITVERDPLGRETRYLYDTEGNVIAITAPDGSSTQIDYHETLNLPITVNDPAGRITAYDYDKRGNLISITDPAGYTTSYGYNAQWLPETITDALGKTRRLHYDTLDQLVCFTDCTGETTRFGYTEYGDLETVTDALGHTFAYAYDPMGRLKSQRTIQNGTPTPRGKQNPLAGGAVNRRYAYDKAGNLIQSADQRSGVLNYVYDKIGRIQEARNSQTGRCETFAFDPAHNILDIPTSTPSPVGEGKTTAPISDDPQTQGRLKSPANPNLVSGNRLKEYNGIEYTYDALGNLIYRQLPNGENQYYQYDLENQLVRAEIKKPAGNTEIWTYAYDPFGRRLSKERQDKLAWTSTEPKRTHFVWDGSRLLQEYTYKGSYTYIYTDPDSYEPLAQVFDNAKDGKQYLAYFHTDQVGIPREMTDIHGNLLWYGEYTAWGRLKKDERVYKNAHQPFRLQNQYFDEETGLHYNLMRYYEPEAGRFVNQDPIGLLGGDNLYEFSPNINSWFDPLGLSPRNLPGIASGSGNSIGKKWLKGTHGNAGVFPKSVADKLRGKSFDSFDDFRAAFWKEVAKDPKLVEGFSEANKKRMAQGKAPKAAKCQHDGKVSSYQIHHKTPINRGGGVYDMDNMLIVTPKFHKEILDPKYHFGRG